MKLNRKWLHEEFVDLSSVSDKEFVEKLKLLAKTGVAAAVYTQTTDVEVEVNGLITYDRKVVKVDEKRMAEINRSLIEF